MTENRLRYDTIGGHLSEAGTYAQLIEHLRLAQEASAMLGHYKKANDNELTGQGFLGISQLLEQVVIRVTKLATKGVTQ
jgi:hypothetical protein